MVGSASHFHPVVASNLTPTNDLVILGGGCSLPKRAVVVFTSAVKSLNNFYFNAASLLYILLNFLQCYNSNLCKEKTAEGRLSLDYTAVNPKRCLSSLKGEEMR